MGEASVPQGMGAELVANRPGISDTGDNAVPRATLRLGNSGLDSHARGRRIC